MAGWMINCKEHAKLLSQSLDQSMPFWEKVSMKMHQFLCPVCKQLRIQFDAIRNVCRLTPEDDESMRAEPARLNDEVCERIKSVLRKSMKEKDA